ncbi:MAG: hypothetical protein WAN46_22150, partial [Gammaproteobacteria bacterium]
AFMRAAQNAFNYSRLGTVAFRTLADLIEASDCFELAYGNLGGAVDALNTLSRAAPAVAECSPP